MGWNGLCLYGIIQIVLIMKTLKSILLTTALIPALLTNVSAQNNNKNKPDKKHHDQSASNKGSKNHSGGKPAKVYSYSELHIPPGHLPPPGACRVWYPNKPPGHQPAPIDCPTAGAVAPPGTWVITHQGDRYRVNRYDLSTSNSVENIRYYWLR